MATVLIIDNSNLAYRAFYGTYRGPGTPILSHNGQATNAIATWANMIPALLFKAKADEVVFAIDGEPTRRLGIFPEYKAGRAEKPVELRSQIPIISEIVRQSGYSFIEDANEEADDMIVEYARQSVARGHRVIIASADKDFSQILGEEIRQVVPANGGGWNDVGPAEVLAKYGVPPSRMDAYLAMIGDTSDNTPGIEGIGPGKATKLLAQDVTLDELCAGVAKFKKAMGPAEIRRLLVLNFELIRPIPVPSLQLKAADSGAGAVRICETHNCRRAAAFFSASPVKAQKPAPAPVAAAAAKFVQAELF